MKRIIKKIILIILIFVCFFMQLSTFCDEYVEEDIKKQELEEIISSDLLLETTGSVSNEPSINSKAAIVYERNTGTILYEKEAYTKRAMASTTKIMTSIIVLEKENLEDKVIVSKRAGGIGGSTIDLKTGDELTVESLLYGLMLKSGNDAAVALAEHIGGSVEGFSEIMNNKAKELGLENTNFVTPHGLDSENHYTTAYDFAILTDYALKNKKFSEIVNTKLATISINGRDKKISNTNELLGNLNGVYGVKTGFTNGAGRCLVTATKRDEMDIIVIVFGADTKKYRTTDSVKLIEYAFSKFQILNIKSQLDVVYENWKNDNKENFNINKGVRNNLNTYLQELENYNIVVNKENINNITYDINVLYNYEAPLEKDKKIGEVRIKVKDEVAIKLNIYNKEIIKKKNIFNYMKDFFSII